jgi:hypothetical protein
MGQVHYRLELLACDDAAIAERCSAELAADLCALGTVEALAATTGPTRDPAAQKSAMEFTVAALSLVTSMDLDMAQAVIEVVTGFLRRNPERSLRLSIGQDVELVLENPSTQEVYRALEVVESALRGRGAPQVTAREGTASGA